MTYRTIWKNIGKEIKSKESVVITGPRRVGKTTTLRWILKQVQSENKKYIDLEVLSNRDIFSLRNYDAILNELQSIGLDTSQKMYIALDEIQLLPNLPSVVKYLGDTYDIKFFLSGSSSYYLKNRFTESLAGRKVIFEMFPLSFQEFLRFHDLQFKVEFNPENPNYITDATYNRLASYYEEFVRFGGMPAVVLADSKTKKIRILNEIFTSYISLDVQTLLDLNSMRGFRELIKLLASRIGTKLNVTRLSKILGISRPTIYSYLEFLEQTYIISRVYAHTDSGDVRSRIGPKIYFVDSGMASINAQLSDGSLFENTVRHQLSFCGDISYFSDSSSKIDFIVNKNTGFEVKVHPVKKDLQTLSKNAAKLNLRNYYLIGKGNTKTFNTYIYGGSI